VREREHADNGDVNK